MEMPRKKDSNPAQEVLRGGKPLIFSKDEPEGARTVSAAWIEEAVAAKSAVYIQNAIVAGTINLKYAELEREFSLIDCEVQSCDFSYTVFRRNLSLEKSQFKYGAEFARAIFETDTILDGAKFLSGEVGFRDIQAKGVFSANGITLADGVPAVFDRARLERTAKFLKATFGGLFSFRGVILGDQGAFQGVHFKAVAHFNACRFGHHALFRSESKEKAPAAMFDNDAYFDGVQFGGQALFQGAVFKKIASFNCCKVTEDAFFGSADEQTEDPAEQSEVVTRFEGETDFIGMQVSGRAYFGGVLFGTKVNFDSASLTGGAEFTLRKKNRQYGAQFNGPASFHRAQIGGADFRNVVFGDTATFSLAFIDGSANFGGDNAKNVTGCVFRGDANFGHLRITGPADFRGTTFGRKAIFNLANLEGAVFFRSEPKSGTPSARFEGDADFVLARFGSEADFQRVKFRGATNFDGARVVGNARFDGAAEDKTLFVGSSSFRNVRCEREVSFDFAQFKGGAWFSGCRIDGRAQFVSALFEADADFSGGHFAHDTHFQGATFKKDASFNSTRFDANAFFERAVFASAPEADPTALANFRGAQFKGVADFQFCTFQRPADFYAARCDSLVRFQETSFGNVATFRGSFFKAVDFSESGLSGDGEQFAADVDLRGFTYDRIQVNWRILMKHAKPYDRQPYSQLENTFRMIGQDTKADEVYLERQTVERRGKWENEEFHSWARSSLYWLFLRYGVRPYRLFIFSFVLIVLGTMFFQLAGTVKLREREAITQVDPLTFRESVGVSVRHFLPFDVPIGASWVPSDTPISLHVSWTNPPQVYKISPSDFATIVLRIPGWLLIPLLVVGFSGLARRKL